MQRAQLQIPTGGATNPHSPETRGQARAGQECSCWGGRAGTLLHLIITDNCCCQAFGKSALPLQSQAGEAGTARLRDSRSKP